MDHRPAGPDDHDQGEELVLRLIADHADSLLRVARRHSICADDAQDAYQRGLEILVRHAWRLDPERAVGWLHTVVRREALALNRARRRDVGAQEVDVDGFEASTSRSPEEAVLGFERVERSAAALKQLKPQELRALWLRALGYSYQEICERTNWTYTKVNRCLAEGRRSFLERYAGLEAGEECLRLAPGLSALVDGEADAASMVELRAHLRHCRACRTVVRELRGAARPLAAVFPLGGLIVAEVAEPAGHFAVRLYEAAVVSLNERAANAVLRAQAVIDAVSATKVAAVASAAVAVTGGGVAVGGAVRGGEPRAPARPVARVAQAAASPSAAPTPPRRRPGASTPAAPRRAAAGASTRAATVAGDARPRTPAPPASEPAAASGPAQPESSTAGADAASASSEFGFEG